MELISRSDSLRGPGVAAPGSPSATRMDRACLVVCVLIFAILAGIHTFRRTYSDTAFFGGDTWEYQSMGVNIAKGHGPRGGAIEPFEVYRFEPMVPDAPHKAGFLRSGAEGGDYNFFRTPGYPYFLGMIYAVAGVRPAVVKRIQAWLWILVGSFLPYLGFRFWRGPGFLGGLLAAPAYLQHSRGTADEILTETLIVFALFVTVLAYLRWSRVRSTASLILLGVSVGVALLVKGSLMFLPLLYLGHVFWSGRHDPFRTVVRRALVFACSVGVVVLPYSVFASVTEGRIIILSTQGSVLLLQGNNELAVGTGRWEPNGSRSPKSFYRRADIEPLPSGMQVVRFYQANPGALLEILPRKIEQGFGSLAYLRLLCWMLMSTCALELLTGMRALEGRQFLAVATAVVMAVVAGAVVEYGGIGTNGLLLVTALVWITTASRRCRLRRLLPIPVMVCFVNFFLVTMITFGHPRVTGVMDFLVVLTAVAGTVWLCVEGLRHLAGRAEPVRRADEAA